MINGVYGLAHFRCDGIGCNERARWESESSIFPGILETISPADIIKQADEQIGWLITEEGNALCPKHRPPSTT